MPCQICEKRKPRRHCPAVRGGICPVCCGEEREQTLDCPLDCEYLREARSFEKPRGTESPEAPFAEVKLTDSLMERNDTLVEFAAALLMECALSTPAIIDADVRECLEALARTYKSLESGILYESVPNNILAAGLYHRIHGGIRQLRETVARQSGVTTIRDADVLAVFVFLARMAADHDNGRRRGRAFIDFLRSYFAESAGRRAGQEAGGPQGSPIVLP